MGSQVSGSNGTTDSSDSWEGTIPDRFDRVARAFPSQIAVRDLERTLTYAELAAEVQAVAGALAGVGGREDPLALVAPLSSDLVTGFLGGLAAGRTVLPLDPDHPADRNYRIAGHAGTSVALAPGALASATRGLLPAGTPIVELGSAPQIGPARRPAPDDAAFVIYTSGSTGAPKGVVHSHRGALASTRALSQVCEMGPQDRLGLFFAGTMTTVALIGIGVLTGAALHILPAQSLGAESVAREILERELTVLHLTPTLLRRVAEKLVGLGPARSVRVVRLMGDRCDWSDVELIRQAFGPDVRIKLGIASTEVPISYANWTVDDQLKAQGGRLPVGRPSEYHQLKLLDDDGRPVAPDEIGEAVVSSPRVALGYWREPALTAAAFRTDPDDPAARVFATGDMCRLRPDGLLEFVGRKDQLVKLRGHRIEPAGVEAALRACAGVADAALVIRLGPDRRPRSLAAYVERRPADARLLSRHVMAMISRRLPAYMIPSAIYLEPLPRLPNFKIDRQALELQDAARASDPSPREGNPMLDQVAGVFEAVIGCRGATGEDDLLSLGGDSLQVVELMLELERQLGRRISRPSFLASRNLAELAIALGEGQGGSRAISTQGA